MKTPQKTQKKKKRTVNMSGRQRTGKTPAVNVNRFRKKILGWYDRHRRVLPWRALPGEKADPYHVWLSEVMLQQTVVAAVIPYFLKFIGRWPTVHDLAVSEQQELMGAWAGLGYYARARNLHKCAQIVSKEKDGIFPDSESELKKLPGIGDYTAAAIRAIAFDRPSVVMDGNIERVLARYFDVMTPLPAAKKILKEHAGFLSDDRQDRPGDYAQALMDLGATVCSPKAPRCILCPLKNTCRGHQNGHAEELPRRNLKKEKPKKTGYIYWIEDERGCILFERRPDKAMLGGMIGLPVSDWVNSNSGKPAHNPLTGHCHALAEQNDNLRIFHSFTHFDLELQGCMLKAKRNYILMDREGLFWADPGNVAKLGLPTVFKKFVKIMLHDGTGGIH